MIFFVPEVGACPISPPKAAKVPGMHPHLNTQPTAEHVRLDEDRRGLTFWKRWGTYVSERSWATVREDYSPHGTAWDFFPHDHARSRAYRWGEDGIAGICDNHGRLCLALAFSNGRDPILKERLFGCVAGEGNRAEVRKEDSLILDL